MQVGGKIRKGGPSARFIWLYCLYLHAITNPVKCCRRGAIFHWLHFAFLSRLMSETGKSDLGRLTGRVPNWPSRLSPKYHATQYDKLMTSEVHGYYDRMLVYTFATCRLSRWTCAVIYRIQIMHALFCIQACLHFSNSPWLLESNVYTALSVCLVIQSISYLSRACILLHLHCHQTLCEEPQGRAAITGAKQPAGATIARC